MTFELRPYQLSAIASLREALRQGNTRVMLYSATGSGKTEIAMSLISSAIAKGKRVVFLCNRIHLVNQSSRRFLRSGIPHGVIQGDNTRHTHERVIVASIQTVARRGMPDCDLVVIDEAHAVAGSKDFRSVIFERNAIPVIGLSATPYSRGLGKHYKEIGGALFESLVIATSIQGLVADGFLVDVDVFAPADPDMTGIKTVRNAFGEMDYSDADVGRAVDKPQLVGDIVKHWMRLSRGLPTVCFAANIAHSKHIVESFRAVGVAAEHVDCYTSEEERIAILARVDSGETTIISNVGILCEGWDFPACRTLILARPTRSLVRYVQMAGRVLRPCPGKTKALILDHSGTVQRLGFPTDDFPLELDDGKPRTAGKQQERTDPLPKPCPKCHFVKPPEAHACPSCGFAPERQSNVETIAGDLVKQERRKPITKNQKQHVFSQLLFIERQRGYRHGWAANQYRSIFDVWPRGLNEVAATPTQEILNKVRANQIAYSKRREKVAA